jgi:hypothetical protein
MIYMRSNDQTDQEPTYRCVPRAAHMGNRQAISRPLATSPPTTGLIYTHLLASTGDLHFILAITSSNLMLSLADCLAMPTA